MSKNRIRTPDVGASEGAGVNQLSSTIDVYVPDCNKPEHKIQEEINVKFTPKKKNSLRLSEVYTRIGEDKRFLRVSDCGSYLGFRADNGQLVEANFCKDRLCSMCNWRRSLKMFGQVSQEMNLLEKQGYRYIFFTPTIKNCSGAELSGTLNTLQKGNAELLRNPDFKRAVVGAIKISEITTLRYDDYHPHFHYILAVRPSYFGQDYLSQAKWVQIWRSCCKLDYDPRCDVRAFKGDKKAIAEASKYTLKSTDIFKGTEIQIDDTVRTLMTSLFNRRLVSWTGVFAQARKQLMLDDVENGDLINTNIEAIRADVAEQIIHYGWRSGFYNRL